LSREKVLGILLNRELNRVPGVRMRKALWWLLGKCSEACGTALEEVSDLFPSNHSTIYSVLIIHDDDDGLRSTQLAH